MRLVVLGSGLWAGSGCREEVALPNSEQAERESRDTGEEEEEYVPCEEVELDVLGPTEPVVGDVWVVWLDCDGVRLVGYQVLAVDPPEIAVVDENEMTFQYAGEGWLSLSAGRYSDETTFVVGEAP
jgi:hypothetical protein